ncbi:hypothetical protein D3C87_1066120 [compost metagenome]
MLQVQANLRAIGAGHYFHGIEQLRGTELTQVQQTAGVAEVKIQPDFGTLAALTLFQMQAAGVQIQVLPGKTQGIAHGRLPTARQRHFTDGQQVLARGQPQAEQRFPALPRGFIEQVCGLLIRQITVRLTQLGNDHSGVTQQSDRVLS